MDKLYERINSGIVHYYSEEGSLERLSLFSLAASVNFELTATGGLWSIGSTARLRYDTVRYSTVRYGSFRSYVKHIGMRWAALFCACA